MTKALAALHDTTYGGVYYSANVDFTNALVQPTWTKLSTTGLANLLVKVMQVDALDPYNSIYVQLDNDDVYRWNGSSWTKIIDLATAQTLSGLASGVAGYISANKTIAGRVYFPMSYGPAGGGSTRVLVSTDYGANWTSKTVKDYTLTTTPAYVSATGDHVWCCYGDLYHALQYSNDNGTTWLGLYQIWASSGGGSPINVDPLDGTKLYFAQSAIDSDLMRYYYSAGYNGTELQSGKNLADVYLSTNPHKPGLHWISRITSGKQRILIITGAFKMYRTADAWANLSEASPTDWGAVFDEPVAIHAARENENYVLIGTTGTDHIYAWVGDTTSALPWNVSGTNWNTSPFTNAIPNSGYISVYGIFVGEGPALSGVYVYSVETGDFDDDHTPMKGDRSAWETMGYADWHAEDVQEDTPQIHAPWPVANGNIIVSDGNKWVETTPAAFGIHNPVTFDADADSKLSVSAGQQITYDTQAANSFLAGPASGAAAKPNHRAIVAADLGSGTADATKYLAGNQVWATFPAVVTMDDILNSIHEHAINEDLSGLCDGSRTVFILANEYRPETTALYLNGVRQLLVTDYTEDAGYDQITMTTAPEAGDILTADYILAGAI